MPASPCDCRTVQQTAARFDDLRRVVWLKCLGCGREVNDDRLRAWATDEALDDATRCEGCGVWMVEDALSLCDSCILDAVRLPVSV